MASPLSDEEIARLFQPYLTEKQIALAVSGGPDSMALLLTATRFCQLSGWNGDIQVLTVNHNLRPEAVREAEFVCQSARALGIKAELLNVTIDEANSNTQMKARDARYKAMSDFLCATAFQGVLLTAHHLDDQAETFFLRLGRGSGVNGLSSMRPFSTIDHGICVARPFLNVRKDRLMATVEAAGQEFILDPSNKNTRFDRIKIRNSLSLLEDLGLKPKRIAQTTAHLQRASRALDHYVDRHLFSSVSSAPGGAFLLSEAPFRDAPEEIRLRSLSNLIRFVSGSIYGPRFEQLSDLLAALDETGLDETKNERLNRASGVGRALTVKRVLGGVVLDRKKSGLWLYREAGRKGLCVNTIGPGETIDWDRRYRICNHPDSGQPIEIGPLGQDHLLFEWDRSYPAALKSVVPAIRHNDELYIAHPVDDQKYSQDQPAHPILKSVSATYRDPEFQQFQHELSKVKQIFDPPKRKK